MDDYMDDFAYRLDSHATGGSFLSWLADPTKVDTAYTASDYRRLQTLKAVYDSTKLFGYPNILPAQ